MTYITATLTIIITLCCIGGWWQQLACSASFLNNFQHSTFVDKYTRNVTLKQGVLQGIVVGSRTNDKLIPVAHYRGIPYAAPPVGDLRFMPPGSPVDFGQMIADTFMPVCPQRFPDPRTMDHDRRQQFLRLQEYLMNQSEDCLYLNVYAPYPEMIQGLHTGDFVEDERQMCYLKCTFRKANIMDADGNIDMDRMVSLLPPEMDTPATQKVLRDCGIIDVLYPVILEKHEPNKLTQK